MRLYWTGGREQREGEKGREGGEGGEGVGREGREGGEGRKNQISVHVVWNQTLLWGGGRVWCHDRAILVLQRRYPTAQSNCRNSLSHDTPCFHVIFALHHDLKMAVVQDK